MEDIINDDCKKIAITSKTLLSFCLPLSARIGDILNQNSFITMLANFAKFTASVQRKSLYRYVCIEIVCIML